MSKIKGKFVDQNFPINGDQLKLENDQNLVAKKVDGTDQSLLKLNANDDLEFVILPKVTSSPSDPDHLVKKSYVDDAVSSGPTQVLFGSPDGTFIDHSEFLTYDASIGLMINEGGQQQMRPLGNAPEGPAGVFSHDTMKIEGNPGDGIAKTRMQRDTVEATKDIGTAQYNASMGWDGTDSWLGVSKTENAGNNISMSKIFPHKAQLFTVDIASGNGPQPILPVEDYDFVVKKYVDDAVSGIDLSTKADLVDGKVPSSQLPSYVDDVEEYANFASLPATGESSKIYVTLDTNKCYRWSGSAYVEISSSPEVSVGIAQTKIVSRGGNDVSGDGTFTKPFATIAAALTSITDASPTKRYIIKVESGAYTEGTIALKPNVFIVGDMKEAVRITASSFTLDAGFSGTGDHRSGLARVIINNAVNFDWNAVTSQAGKIYCSEVSFSSTINLNGYNNATAQAQFNDCLMFGAMTISGINVGVFKDNFVFNNITLNQHTSLPSIINIDGGTCDTLRFNAAVSDFNRRSAGFIRNFQSQNLIVDGPSAYADYTLESGSKTGAQSLNGGNLVPLTPKLSQDLETKMLKPISTNAHNSGDWGKQWFFNFANVHASTGSDLYLSSLMESYDATGDSSGKNIFIQADGYGLKPNVNGGNIELETGAVSGTGIRGKVQVKARELDLTSVKIVNVADPTADQDAATKKYVDDGLAAKQNSIGTGSATDYLAGDLTWKAQITGKKEIFTLAAADITNGYIDCAFLALPDTMRVITGGVEQIETESYSLSTVSGKTRITWIGDLVTPTPLLVEGDTVYVQYMK